MVEEQQQKQSPLLDLQSFKALSVLGRGAKGVAFLVTNQSLSHKTLALKTISKSFVIHKKKNINNNKKQAQHQLQEEVEEEDPFKRIWFERDVLALFDHPLLPQLKGLVLTDDIIAFAIDYCPGGHLNSLRKQQTENMFSIDIIRFYAAELVLAIEYLHSLGIVYRDLKPENILIQENGHLMLVDFDLSTKLSLEFLQTPPPSSNHSPKCKKKNWFRRKFSIFKSGISPIDDSTRSVERVDSVGQQSNSFVGTEQYVAPEVVLGKGHHFAVDWWGLGVVLHEMLYGYTPFRGINRKETFYRILTKTPDLIGEENPLRDLIRKLLEKDPTKRISVEEIKRHDFFQGVKWDSILEIYRPPFIPSPFTREDEKYMEEIQGIDVASFVMQERLSDVEKERETETKKNEDNNIAWVKTLNLQSSDFLVF